MDLRIEFIGFGYIRFGATVKLFLRHGSYYQTERLNVRSNRAVHTFIFVFALS